MSQRFVTAMVLAVLGGSLGAASQTQPAAKQTFEMVPSALRGYHNLQRNLTEAAEKMSDADYAFKPTPEMRPFSQLVAHVALAQFGNCSVLKGQPNPHEKDKEETYKTKPEALALLKASTALCDEAVGSVTDQNMLELVAMPQGEVARGLMLTGTNSHGNEMYGTMSVYLRLKGIVPPSTERAQQAAKAAAAKESEQKKSGSGK